jgi:HK97 family phage prohead protease
MTDNLIVRQLAIVDRDVDPTRRLIDLRVVRYDTPYDVEDWMGAYAETYVRGVFDDSLEPDRKYRAIKLTRDHSPARVVGRMIGYQDDGRELLATLSVSRTVLGDETLELARDEVLAASLGAQLVDGGSLWSDDHKAVRHERLRLREIALTPFPALDDAGVLAVRSRSSAEPVPNLAEVRAWLDAMG